MCERGRLTYRVTILMLIIAQLGWQYYWCRLGLYWLRIQLRLGVFGECWYAVTGNPQQTQGAATPIFPCILAGFILMRPIVQMKELERQTATSSSKTSLSMHQLV